MSQVKSPFSILPTDTFTVENTSSLYQPKRWKVHVVLRNDAHGSENELLQDQKDAAEQIVNFITRNAAHIQVIHLDFDFRCYFPGYTSLYPHRPHSVSKASLELFHPSTHNTSTSVAKKVDDYEKTIFISVCCGQVSAGSLSIFDFHRATSSIATLAEDMCCFVEPFSTISSLKFREVSPQAVDEILRHFGSSSNKSRIQKLAITRAKLQCDHIGDGPFPDVDFLFSSLTA